MARNKRNPNQVAVGIIVFAALSFVGSLAWAFGQQVVCAQQMRVEEARLERAVAAAQARHRELLERLDYVRSDAYVEQWARKEAKMIRPGEVLVIVTGEELDDPMTPSPKNVEQADPSRPFWIHWWDWLTAPGAREAR